MSKWQGGSTIRRTLAHATTPLLAGLVASLLFSDGGTILDRLGTFVPGSYLVWLLLGLPATLLSSRRPRRIWTYAALAGLVVAFPLLVIGPVATRADLGLSLTYLTIAVVACVWYWFCADWAPRRATLAGIVRPRVASAAPPAAPRSPGSPVPRPASRRRSG
jgi:hypothetical protein